MRNTVLFFFGLLLLQSCASQNTKHIDWKSDLDFISTELPKKHKNFFATKDEKKFLSGIKSIKSNLGGETDFEIALNLQKLIATFGDSHTRVNLGQFVDKQQILPLHLYWFSDGIRILQTTPEYAEILGNKIISLNGTPIETIVDSLSLLITADNQALVQSSVPKILPLMQVLKHFGFAQTKEVELELETLDENITKYKIEPALLNRKNRKMFQPDSIAFCIKNEKVLFTESYFTDEKIYYLQYNKCWGKELAIRYENGRNANRLPSFEDFASKVLKTLESKPIEKLVFDMRLNGGGSSPQGTKLTEKIAKHAESNPNLKLYVVLGRRTFSSAIINAMDFKRLTNAIFVGEDTGGKPNHFGEVRNFRLPNSGLRVDYSTKYFKNTDEDVNTIMPDKKLEASFENFQKGIDPVYEWIKKQ